MGAYPKVKRLAKYCLLFYCGVRTEPAFTWKHCVLQLSTAALVFLPIFLQVVLKLQGVLVLEVYQIAGISATIAAVCVFIFGLLSNLYSKRKDEPSTTKKLAEIFTDIFPPRNALNVILRGLIVGCWVFSKVIYTFWADEWIGWSKISNETEILQHPIPRPNCSGLACGLKIEHLIGTWFYFFVHFLPASTGTYLCKMAYSPNEEEAVNSLAGVTISMFAYAWGTVQFSFSAFFTTWTTYVDVFTIVFPLVIPSLNTLSLMPATLSLGFFILEAIDRFIFGGRTSTINRAIDLCKTTLLALVLIGCVILKMKMIYFVGLSFLFCYFWNLAIMDFGFLSFPCFQTLSKKISFQSFRRKEFAIARHAILPLVLLISLIVIASVEETRAPETLLQREIVFKSVTGVLLVFNAVCYLLVYKETGWLRQAITDFILPGTVCFYQLWNFPGITPFETTVTDDPVLAIFIFHSFRLLWIQPLWFGTASFLSLCLRLITQRVLVTEPFYASELVAPVLIEIVMMAIVAFITRMKFIVQKIRIMVGQNRKNSLQWLFMSVINSLFSSVFATPFIWTKKGSFDQRAWTPNHITKIQRPHSDPYSTEKAIFDKTSTEVTALIEDKVVASSPGTSWLAKEKDSEEAMLIFKHSEHYLSDFLEIFPLKYDVSMARKSVLKQRVIAQEKKLVHRREMNWYSSKLAICLAKNFRDYLQETESSHEQSLKMNQIAPVVRETSDYFQVQEFPASRKTIPGDWHYVPMDVRAALASSSDHQEELQNILSSISLSPRDLTALEALIGALLLTVEELSVEAFSDLLRKKQNEQLNWIRARADLNEILASAALQTFTNLFDDEIAKVYLWDSRELADAIASGTPSIGIKLESDFAEATLFAKRVSNWSVCSVSRYTLQSVFLDGDYFDDELKQALATANFAAHRPNGTVDSNRLVLYR